MWVGLCARGVPGEVGRLKSVGSRESSFLRLPAFFVVLDAVGIGMVGGMLRTALLLAFLSSAAISADVPVADSDALGRALREAKPGTVIRLAPGRYAGGHSVSGVNGTAAAPIVVAGAAGGASVIEGGASGIHLAGCSYWELRDVVFSGATANGINIDDGGKAESPAKGIVLRGLDVRNNSPRGNRDGIKLSGVDSFTVPGCKVSHWGDGGSGIDMVGCRKGVIEQSTFTHGENAAMANGVQTKGGSEGIVVRKCVFTNAGGRAVNIGGSTGAPYFRPLNATAEARDITVEECHFTGSMAPIAFVGVDGAIVRNNTITNPGRWVVRILQENQNPAFAPCRNGVFSGNRITFRSSLAMAVNIGGGTEPKSFRFEKNAWLCEDAPASTRAALKLPMEEAGGVYGQPIPATRSASDGGR